MAYLIFIGTVIACGAIAAFIPVDTMSSRVDAPDYHLIPYAGDAWGA